MKYKFGLDFGTTNSSIAIRCINTDDISQSEITQVIEVKPQYPKETMPSLVWAGESGKIIAGYKAIEQGKRTKEKGVLIRRIKMDLEEQGSALHYRIGNKVFDGIDLIASILNLLRREAEEYARNAEINVHGVVMGVPVQYGDIQKGILLKSLVKAGFYRDEREAERETEFVSEPVAVAVEYGINIEENKNVMVFDFGGGTLDVAIVNLKKQVGIYDRLHPHETIAKDRMTLGGEELNRLFFINGFSAKYGGVKQLCNMLKVPAMNAEDLWRYLCNNVPDFVREIERCKCALSTDQVYKFSYIGAGIFLPEKKIFRKDFEQAIAFKLTEIQNFVDALVTECIQEKKLEGKYDIDRIVVAGGSSLIPSVQQILHDYFGQHKIMEKAQPSEVLTSIVRGLAFIGCRKERQIEDVVDCDYGIWNDQDNVFMPIIERGVKVLDTKIDKLHHAGYFVKVKAQNPSASFVEVKVFQRSRNQTSQLGTIRMNKMGSTHYEVFMQINPGKAKLEVKILDSVHQHWKDEIPLNERIYEIK